MIASVDRLTGAMACGCLRPDKEVAVASNKQVTVIGGGLAGSEAAWTLLRAGYQVTLVDGKPGWRSPAHTTEQLAELVCSNSLRAESLSNGAGLLKAELTMAGSLLIAAAVATRVPAGRALAVDRTAFSAAVTDHLRAAPGLTLRSEEVTALPPADAGPVILATGPLTSAPLLSSLAAVTGADHLAFHDALAPIVDGASIDMDKAFFASRYGEGDDYLNCPLNEAQYHHLRDVLVQADLTPLHDFEKPHLFEGCLPIEEIASRGPLALSFGPLKPVGLRDPRGGPPPYAVVQLRREDSAGQAWNLVGFQTRIKQSAQADVLRCIPGLEGARFLRLGAMHRNAYLRAPVVLDQAMRLRGAPHIQVAGQLAGVEGYVESIGHGLLTALHLIASRAGSLLPAPPPVCALGALQCHVTGQLEQYLRHDVYEPHNVHWGLFPPVERRMRKRERNEYRGRRGRSAFEGWWPQVATLLTEQLAY